LFLRVNEENLGWSRNLDWILILLRRVGSLLKTKNKREVKGMVGVNELVEVTRKMLYRECEKRGVNFDEDLVHDVLLRVWKFFKERFDCSRGVKWTTYVWYVIDSVLRDKKKELQKCRNVLSFDCVFSQQDDESGELFWNEVSIELEESFSEKLLRVLRLYDDIGDDFVRLVIGDVDVSDALRSIKVSKKKGEEWIEWWLGRRLSDNERRCCGEIRAFLNEM
jgi:DNA-directed RNA polymerase specialized sigma24 family protein